MNNNNNHIDIPTFVKESVALVPFYPEFIEKYHTWMQDEQLRKLVDTEEMTLEQVKEAQEMSLKTDSLCKP